MRRYHVAVVGATGLVGKTLLSILSERQFPIATIRLLASHRSVGSYLIFAGQNHPVTLLDDDSFAGVDISFFCAGKQVAEQFAPKALAAGAVVIDKSSYFRTDPRVPLIIPEVNGDLLYRCTLPAVIATPNCSTTQLVLALKPIYDAAGISRVNVTTYQSVSGSGSAALAEFKQQIQSMAHGEPLTSSVYPEPIVSNLLPHIDEFEINGYTREEMKMIHETRRLLADDAILINATAVRVPVAVGHSMAVTVETRNKLDVQETIDILSRAPFIKVMNTSQGHGYPTPRSSAQAEDFVYVGRIREDFSHPNSLNLWIVANNLRKGAALNAVHIAEYLLDNHLLERLPSKRAVDRMNYQEIT